MLIRAWKENGIYQILALHGSAFVYIDKYKQRKTTIRDYVLRTPK